VPDVPLHAELPRTDEVADPQRHPGSSHISPIVLCFEANATLRPHRSGNCSALQNGLDTNIQNKGWSIKIK